jgi:hypothetical protein
MVGSRCGGASKQWVSALLLLALCRTPRGDAPIPMPRLAGSCKYRRCSCSAWKGSSQFTAGEVGRYRDGQHSSAPPAPRTHFTAFVLDASHAPFWRTLTTSLSSTPRALCCIAERVLAVVALCHPPRPKREHSIHKQTSLESRFRIDTTPAERTLTDD